MLRKLAYILLPLALLFMAACSDGSGTGTKTSTPTATTSAAPTDTASDGAQPTTAIGDTDTDPIDSGGGDANGGDALLRTLNPMELFIAASSGEPSTAPDDPALQAALLTQDDLPGDFISLGDFSYNMPTAFGDLHMAAAMFASGEFEGGSMVMSAAIAVAPDKIDELGDPSEWGSATQADLERMQGIFEDSGIGLTEFNLLDAEGLGDGGLGFHLTMDLGALIGAFGPPDEADLFAEGISMDMYMFLRGDRMLMTIVMWPAGTPSGVDGHALAERMDERAISAPASR